MGANSRLGAYSNKYGMHHFVIDDLFCPNLLLAIEICRKNEKN